MTVNFLSAQHLPWERKCFSLQSVCCQANNFSVASCTAIATTFLIQIPKEILFLPFWEAWLGVSSFACLALYYKQFLQPWHTQVQIALLFGSYLWTGTQDKANGRSSLATVCCPQQYIRNKPIWRIPSRKIHWSAFSLLFFLSVKQWAVWKWRGKCFIYYFCYFSLSFILWYLNTRNRKYCWLLDPFLYPSLSCAGSTQYWFRQSFCLSGSHTLFHSQHSNFPLFLSMYEHSSNKCPFPGRVSLEVR